MRCKRNALLEVNHCLDQRSYVDWKYEHLRNLVRTPPKARRGNGKRMAYRFTTLSLPELTWFYHRFYNRQKVVPKDLELDPLALATWFMDDGSKSRKTVYFNTQQFSLGCQCELQQKLAGLGIKCSLNRDKGYYRLWVSVSSMGRLKELVSPYLLPMFSYKLPQ